MPKVKIVTYDVQKHREKLKEIAAADHPLIEKFDETPGIVNLVYLNEKDEVIGNAQLITTVYIKNINIDQSIEWRDRVKYFWAMVAATAKMLEIRGNKFWFLFKKKDHNGSFHKIRCPKIYNDVATNLTHKQYKVFANFGD